MTIAEKSESYKIRDILVFLALTIGISLLAFALMVLFPTFQSPENLKAMPVWLLAVWSPNVAAILVASGKGRARAFFQRNLSVPRRMAPLVLTLLPLGLLFLLGATQPMHTQGIEPKHLMLLVLMNLMMGPLGEEPGWRGFLYPALRISLGWMGAALLVGFIWALWHAPLWFVDSPQREIPFLIFAGNVILFSVLMSILHDLTGPSILSAVLMHLAINVSAGLYALFNMGSQTDYWTYSLIYFAILSAALALIRQYVGYSHCANTDTGFGLRRTKPDPDDLQPVHFE